MGWVVSTRSPVCLHSQSEIGDGNDTDEPAEDIK